MKALTLLQPWAQLVAVGAKHYETRSWSRDYTGPLAIHAAAAIPGPAKTFARTALVRASLRGLASEDLPLGQVVAVCSMLRCVPTSSLIAAFLPGDESSFGDFTRGRYAFILVSVRQLSQPIPARGRLSFWEWEPPSFLPPEDEAALRSVGVSR